LEDVIISAKEVNLLNGNRTVAQPDIVAINKRGDLYIVEYKCNHQTNPAKGHMQLRIAEHFIYDQFGIPVKKIYVTGKEYDVEYKT